MPHFKHTDHWHSSYQRVLLLADLFQSANYFFIWLIRLSLLSVYDGLTDRCTEAIISEIGLPYPHFSDKFAKTFRNVMTGLKLYLSTLKKQKDISSEIISLLTSVCSNNWELSCTKHSLISHWSSQ